MSLLANSKPQVTQFGILEYWSVGRLSYENIKRLLDDFFRSCPHYSINPLFHVSPKIESNG